MRDKNRHKFGSQLHADYEAYWIYTNENQSCSHMVCEDLEKPSWNVTFSMHADMKLGTDGRTVISLVLYELSDRRQFGQYRQQELDLWVHCTTQERKRIFPENVLLSDPKLLLNGEKGRGSVVHIETEMCKRNRRGEISQCTGVFHVTWQSVCPLLKNINRCYLPQLNTWSRKEEGINETGKTNTENNDQFKEEKEWQ